MQSDVSETAGSSCVMISEVLRGTTVFDILLTKFERIKWVCKYNKQFCQRFQYFISSSIFTVRLFLTTSRVPLRRRFLHTSVFDRRSFTFREFRKKCNITKRFSSCPHKASLNERLYIRTTSVQIYMEGKFM